MINKTYAETESEVKILIVWYINLQLTNVNTSNASLLVLVLLDVGSFVDRPRTFPLTGTAVIPLPFVIIFSLVGGGSGGDWHDDLCDFLLLLFIALYSVYDSGFRFYIANTFLLSAVLDWLLYCGKETHKWTNVWLFLAIRSKFGDNLFKTNIDFGFNIFNCNK